LGRWPIDKLRGGFKNEILLLAGAAAVALSAGMTVADYKLTILHTNDFHARFELDIKI